MSLTFENLVKAYYDCRKRKRNSVAALDFEFNLEENLINLYDELQNGTYEIGLSICFMVLDPKPREVWAADFRDRIVHHLIYNEISPRFYNRFIKDTYSCIPERGTLNAGLTIQGYARALTQNYTKSAYFMKADIKNFFVSINRDILFSELQKFVQEKWILDLLEQIVYNDCKKNCKIQSPRWKFNLLPKYKSLWFTKENKGLPIGNLTSQFFSNVYLNSLDQYIKRKWHCKYYCRYVDDFVILDTDPHKLNEIHKDLTKFLKKRLDLELHQNKKSINKIERGIDFVGFVSKPNRVMMRQKTMKRIFRTIRKYKRNEQWFNEKNVEDFVHSMNSYLGILRCTNGYSMRRSICAQCVSIFISCDKDYTKLVNNFKLNYP